MKATFLCSKATMRAPTKTQLSNGALKISVGRRAGNGSHKRHLNNLDLLTVSPSMSKRHSDLLAEHGNTVAPCDTIWKAVEQVWKDLDSPPIARGFVLVYHLAKRVVEFKG
jgi:hypothetical protein